MGCSQVLLWAQSRCSVQSGRAIYRHGGQRTKHVGFEPVDYVYRLQHPVGMHLAMSQVYISVHKSGAGHSSMPLKSPRSLSLWATKAIFIPRVSRSLARLFYQSLEMKNTAPRQTTNNHSNLAGMWAIIGTTTIPILVSPLFPTASSPPESSTPNFPKALLKSSLCIRSSPFLKVMRSVNSSNFFPSENPITYEICAVSLLRTHSSHVTGLFLSDRNTIEPAIDLLALVLREASRDQ